MTNFQVVECLKATHNLDEVVPDLFLAESVIVFLFVIDQLQDVAAISILHYDAEAIGRIFEKGFLVADYIRMADACEDSDLVESVLFLFAAEFLHFHFFHCVNGVVRLSSHLVDFAE